MPSPSALIVLASASLEQALANTPQGQPVLKQDALKPLIEAFLKAFPMATIKRVSMETDRGNFVHGPGAWYGFSADKLDLLLT